MPERRIRIEEYIPYLLNRVAMNMVKRGAKRFENLRLSVPSWRILFALREHESCGFGELVTLTSIEPATLSRLIGQLHRRKLVRREKPPSDNRSLKISLTPAGIKLFDRSLPFAQEVETTLLEGVSKTEARTLRKTLVRLYDNLQKQVDKEEP